MYDLEIQLEELQGKRYDAVLNNVDESTLIGLLCDIAEVQDEIGFGWQD